MTKKNSRQFQSKKTVTDSCRFKKASTYHLIKKRVQNIQNVTPFSHFKKGVTLGVTKGVTPKPAEIKALRALVTPFTPFLRNIQ